MEKNDDILLKVEHLKKYYPVKSSSLKRSNGFVKAVDDISFDVKVGETFGIVGESGCGKSTMGKSVIRLIEPTDGKVILDGQDFTALKGKELKKARISIDILLEELRKEKVAFATWEPDGKISVFLQPKYEPITPSSLKIEI